MNGGRGNRSPAEGAAVVVKLAILGVDGPTGGFFGTIFPISTMSTAPPTASPATTLHKQAYNSPRHGRIGFRFVF
jgi:hypothetical protein